MDDLSEIQGDWGKRERLVEHLDRLVASGRLTEGEAERLRTADDPDAFNAVLREIRVRHARATLEAAVDGGQMTRTEADEVLERMSRGEHGPSLRRHVGRLQMSARGRPQGSGAGHTEEP